MKNNYPHLTHCVCLAVMAPFFAGPVCSQTLSGTLSNFDVFNDTNQVSRGFEIELQGLTSRDIAGAFGGTYIRYGDPTVVEIPGGVVIRYASPYDAVRRTFTTGTPIPAAFTATAGHQCWTGGSAGYPTSGCEHFGVGLTRAPTAVVYRWLIEDAANPGALKASGSSVNIPAPLWVVTAGAAGVAPLVNAAIAPPKPVGQPFGEAVWVKVYEAESPETVELKHLLTDDPVVPHSAGQTEVEWELLQFNPKKVDNGSLQHGKPLGKGSQSVIRRFEFYKYTGAYDPENHEALCSARSGGKGSDCSAPQASELGGYIGAQMVAAQFGQPVAPKLTITGVTNSASGQNTISSGAWVSIYGAGLSASSRSWQDSDFKGSSLPTTLDDVSVTINGSRAAIAFISPGQLNVQAPSSSAVGPVAVQVNSPLGTTSGTVTMQQYSPALFTLQEKYVAAVHTDGVLVGAPGFFGAGVASRPARPGEVLLIFGTGFGPTFPAIPPGQVVGTAARLADMSQLHLRIGGVVAEVQFAGIVAAGEYQFNVLVPPLPDGDQPVMAEVSGVSSIAGIVIPIKN